jgi:hypothetical protein
VPVTITETGLHTVTWQSVSSDGHTISGSYTFSYAGPIGDEPVTLETATVTAPPTAAPAAEPTASPSSSPDAEPAPRPLSRSSPGSPQRQCSFSERCSCSVCSGHGNATWMLRHPTQRTTPDERPVVPVRESRTS